MTIPIAAKNNAENGLGDVSISTSVMAQQLKAQLRPMSILKRMQSRSARQQSQPKAMATTDLVGRSSIELITASGKIVLRPATVLAAT